MAESEAPQEQEPQLSPAELEAAIAALPGSAASRRFDAIEKDLRLLKEGVDNLAAVLPASAAERLEGAEKGVEQLIAAVEEIRAAVAEVKKIMPQGVGAAFVALEDRVLAHARALESHFGIKI